MSDRGKWYVEHWAAIYLKDALARLKPQLKGYDLTIEDIYVLQQMCAYEVSLFPELGNVANQSCSRPSPWGTQNFAAYSRKRNGTVLTTRKSFVFPILATALTFCA